MRKGVGNSEIEEKLNYLGLNLPTVPKFIDDSILPTFNISRLNNDRDLNVYKFVPIDQIDILLTPNLRSDTIKKKYEEALPLKVYLNSEGTEDEKLMYETFAQIVQNTQIEEIEKVAKVQESFEGEVPFKVKYNRDHLWQIYYSEESDRYFMFVCTKENTFAEFLYLLKSQIELSKKKKKEAPKIYVPINYVGYSEQILKKSEIKDLENYLWLFTKNWPLIFEVHDMTEGLTLQIIGETFVYKNVKSTYKVVLETNDEAMKFFKLLKALFILQTEIKGQYVFETKIDSNNGLNMYLSKVQITFESLTNFIKNEFKLADFEIKTKNHDIEEEEEKIVNLKRELRLKEEEYLQKQKEISTYLECKKTFFGKVKYFFKSDKKDKNRLRRTPTQIDNIEETGKNKVNLKPMRAYIGEKSFYTIEDLVTIYSLHEKCDKALKDLNQELRSLELKIENVNSKVRNANLYIEEIDKHKRSIFEFWKFANKDEKPALEMASKESDSKNKVDIEKSFDLEMDFESLGIKADEIQRKKLSNEELDSLFIAQSGLTPLLNMIRTNQIVKIDLERALRDLKDEFDDDRFVYDTESFDIFGNLDESSKIKYIGNRSHREKEKNKYKILNINRRIDIFDFTEKMQSIVNYIEGAMPKMKSLYSMPLYNLVPISQNINTDSFSVYNIDLEDELKNYVVDDSDGAYNLIVLNYKEDLPMLYFTNSVFYDNTNKTLPMGMDLSRKVLVDNSKLRFTLTGKTKFRTNLYFSDNPEEEPNSPKSKDIFVYEYDVALKSESDSDEENIIDDEVDEFISVNETVKKDDFLENENNYQNSIAENDEIYETPEMQRFSNILQDEDTQSFDAEFQNAKQSRKMQKIAEKYERELEKQQRKEEKARMKQVRKNRRSF